MRICLYERESESIFHSLGFVGLMSVLCWYLYSGLTMVTISRSLCLLHWYEVYLRAQRRQFEQQRCTDLETVDWLFISITRLFVNSSVSMSSDWWFYLSYRVCTTNFFCTSATLCSLKAFHSSWSILIYIITSFSHLAGSRGYLSVPSPLRLTSSIYISLSAYNFLFLLHSE